MDLKIIWKKEAKKEGPAMSIYWSPLRKLLITVKKIKKGESEKIYLDWVYMNI